MIGQQFGLPRASGRVGAWGACEARDGAQVSPRVGREYCEHSGAGSGGRDVMCVYMCVYVCG